MDRRRRKVVTQGEGIVGEDKEILLKSKAEQFHALREKYPAFFYRGYRYYFDDLDSVSFAEGKEGSGEAKDGVFCHIQYDFEIPGLSSFHPSWVFPVRRTVNDRTRKVLNELIFQLGMAETISYYKTSCPEKVVVACGTLTPEQKEWWKKLYYNGLGEFLYRNGIEVEKNDLVSIEAKTPSERGEEKPFADDTVYHGLLVPVGGGKDSAVTLETLRGQEIETYHINDDSAIDEVIEVFHHGSRIYRESRTASRSEIRRNYHYVGRKEDCRARRTLDPNMLELNRRGYLNGHTPFSSIVAFSSVLAAFLTQREYIALSNETSANEPTVRGSSVNHQYSKSVEFEEDFRKYMKEIVGSNIEYFSFLRPFSEIQIAAAFSGCKAYHPVFLSCNKGSKTGIWCCRCPKCLFVYIILSPFLSEEELCGIFGENLLNQPLLEKEFRELLGIDENKPFECVGTRGEVAAALKAYLEQGKTSLLTSRYQGEIRMSNPDLAAYLKGWEERNHVPSAFVPFLRKEWSRMQDLG